MHLLEPNQNTGSHHDAAIQSCITVDLRVLLPRHSPQLDKPHSHCHSAVPAAGLRVHGEEGHEPSHEGERTLRGLGQQQGREDLQGAKQLNMAV